MKTSPIEWERVETGYIGSLAGNKNGLFTIVENFPGQWIATDWRAREPSPAFPSEEEAKAWCENRLPSDPPLPDAL